MRDGDLAESVSLAELPVKGSDRHGMYFNIGTTNGLLYRAEVDRHSGQLTEVRTRYVAGAVTLASLEFEDADGAAVVSVLCVVRSVVWYRCVAVSRRIGCLCSFLGGRPVRLATVRVGGHTALLSLSSRTWLSYRHHNNFLTAPLAYVPSSQQPACL